MPAVIPCILFTWLCLRTSTPMMLSFATCCSLCYLADPVSIHQHRSIAQILPSASLHDTFAINFCCLCFLSTRLSSPLIHSAAVWKWFWRLSCSVELPIGDILHSLSSYYKENTVMGCEGKKGTFLSLLLSLYIYCTDCKCFCFGGWRRIFPLIILLLIIMKEWIHVKTPSEYSAEKCYLSFLYVDVVS